MQHWINHPKQCVDGCSVHCCLLTTRLLLLLGSPRWNFVNSLDSMTGMPAFSGRQRVDHRPGRCIPIVMRCFRFSKVKSSSKSSPRKGPGRQDTCRQWLLSRGSPRLLASTVSHSAHERVLSDSWPNAPFAGFRPPRRSHELAAWTRSPCAVRGSTLVRHSTADPGLIGLSLGTLDDDPLVRAMLHVLVGSKAPWSEIFDDLSQDGHEIPARHAADWFDAQLPI